MEQEEYEKKMRKRLARMIQKENPAHTYIRSFRVVERLSFDEVREELKTRLGSKS